MKSLMVLDPYLMSDTLFVQVNKIHIQIMFKKQKEQRSNVLTTILNILLNNKE